MVLLLATWRVGRPSRLSLEARREIAVSLFWSSPGPRSSLRSQWVLSICLSGPVHALGPLGFVAGPALHLSWLLLLPNY